MTREVSTGVLLGLNNRLQHSRMETTLPGRVKASWLRVAYNIDLTADGLIRSRAGFVPAVAGEWHSIWSDGKGAYGVCNGDLVHIDARTLERTVAVPGVGQGRVRFERLPDGLVYWTNGNRIGRLDGATARLLTTPTPNPAPLAAATIGGLPPGRYQVCFTSLSADGESGSTEPQAIELPNGGGIAFTELTADTRVYATGPDGDVFNEIANGAYLSLTNDGAPCSTFMLTSMPPGQALAHYRGSLLVARGKFLYLSEPYLYGLHDAGRGFIPFPAEISVVLPCEDGIYVGADKTYWLAGDPLATAPVVVLPYGALPGSGATDPTEQTVYWQGPQGVVVAKPGGVVTVPQDEALTFRDAEHGTTWLRDSDGDSHLITTRFGVTP